MIDKIFITKKLNKYFNKIQCETFIKSLMVDFFLAKIKNLNEIVGYEDSIKMFDKYIYNLDKNLTSFKILESYHSIYCKYDYKTKTLKYFLTDDYKKYKLDKLSLEDRKKLIIQEFRIMIYKEFERIIDLYSLNGIIISNGFYIKDKRGRYPEYEGKYSEIYDIFAEAEVCKLLNTTRRIKVTVDSSKKYFVYMNHLSFRNSEVLRYVILWREFFDKKTYCFAVNNPKMYSEQMIRDFNLKYNSLVFGSKYKFMLKKKDVFSLIESYLLHIRNKVNEENNLRYHKDLSKIFEIINTKKDIPFISEYLLNSNES